jgi:hypothetical protein
MFGSSAKLLTRNCYPMYPWQDGMLLSPIRVRTILLVFIYDPGMFLLEVNLSCNFFRGTFSKALYFSIMDRYMKELDEIRRASVPP